MEPWLFMMLSYEFVFPIGNQLELQSEFPSRMYQVCFNKSLGTTAGFCAFEVLFGDENGNWGRRTVSASGNVWASARSAGAAGM